MENKYKEIMDLADKYEITIAELYIYQRLDRLLYPTKFNNENLQTFTSTLYNIWLNDKDSTIDGLIRLCFNNMNEVRDCIIIGASSMDIRLLFDKWLYDID